jgi:hypothetical protein
LRKLERKERKTVSSESPVRKFHHVGLRSREPQSVEHYIAPSKCWITNPNKHPHHVEFLRYAPDSPIADEFKDFPHVAYEVDDLQPHLEGKEVYLAPFEAGEPPFATVAFTREDGVFVEYLKLHPGRVWFDDFDDSTSNG